ncbi:hypothetical protein ACET3X_008126 [Alternaria dauci]|uniref:Thioesterase-like superfamily-domain-containing protein n=1 Tax=Alternaria dauci TaxID=48095 RepID=A0ABR3UBX9_9PLEO
MTGWEQATAVEKLSSNTYSCNLQDDWCIGTVPNGGYVTGCILEVVKTHFNTTLAEQNQPHTITLHVEFLRRTQTGPATYKVEDVKLGRQTSTVHVTMEQDGRTEVVAYVTNSNLDTETGFTHDTGYRISPPIASVDFSKLENDQDPNWYKAELPNSGFRKATKRADFYFRRGDRKPSYLSDQWMCFSDGKNFTNSSIAFAADIFPLMVEWYRKKDEGPFWYPTLLLNLDVKKSLPPEGVKWLQVRVEMKKVVNGRMDLEVFVHDDAGDLVALSHHVALVVDVSRNTAARSTGNAKM